MTLLLVICLKAWADLCIVLLARVFATLFEISSIEYQKEFVPFATVGRGGGGRRDRHPNSEQKCWEQTVANWGFRDTTT